MSARNLLNIALSMSMILVMGLMAAQLEVKTVDMKSTVSEFVLIATEFNTLSQGHVL
jgi:hypothetical protein